MWLLDRGAAAMGMDRKGWEVTRELGRKTLEGQGSPHVGEWPLFRSREN